MTEENKKKIEENKEKFLNEIAQEERDILEEEVAGGDNGNNCTCNGSMELE
ncbi:hypothetical protein [Thalassomonas sp. RHCl1]|uniref:hypothetical protein n=1 Tax=Thalassomonas sp. RHCl1 TaxID=2995320 RepID=UPI00248C7690|nr:hypothetical protein [Thalassomonas sp. RHCl1]